MTAGDCARPSWAQQRNPSTWLRTRTWLRATTSWPASRRPAPAPRRQAVKLRRDIASIPARSAEETWAKIIALVTASGSVDAQQLQAAAGIMATLITEE